MTRVGAGRILSLVASAGLLAGCSAFRSPPPPPCPVPGIVDGLDTRLQAAGRAPGDVVWRAAILGFKGGCGYDAEGALVGIDLELAVTPGPAFGNQPRKVQLPYFVAVADPTGAVVDKQVFTASIDVPAGGAATKVAAERLEQRLRGVDASTGPQWRVYLGFELPREEAIGRRGARP